MIENTSFSGGDLNSKTTMRKDTTVMASTPIKSLLLFVYLFIGSTASAAIEADAPTAVPHDQAAQAEKVISFYEERDLELFCSSNQTHPGLIGMIDRTTTRHGHNALHNLLRQPTTDTTVLTQRQAVIAQLRDNADLRARLTVLLSIIKEHQEIVAPLLEAGDDEMREKVLKNFYFQLKPLLGLNDSAAALDALHYLQFANLFGPVITHMAMHFGLRKLEQMFADWLNGKAEHDKEHAHDHGHNHKKEKKHKEHKHHDHGCGDPMCSHHSHQGSPLWVKGIFFTYNVAHWTLDIFSIKEMIEHMIHKAGLLNVIHQKMVSAAATTKALVHIGKLCQEAGFDQLDQLGLHGLTPALQKQTDLLLQLSDERFATEQDLSVFSTVGNTLRAHALLIKHQEDVKSALACVGELDALTSAAKLMNEQPSRWSFAHYLTGRAAPSISLEHFVSPMLPVEQAVANSMTFDQEHGTNKVILTGPNKAGKSSFIKAVTLNTLLAQSLGIAAASSMQLTPMAKIITYITIADDISNDQSMFVAEVIRAKGCNETLRGLEGKEFSLAIFDDSLFKSTNFDFGQQAAYNFIAGLGGLRSNLTLVVTHFKKLTELERATSGVFKNYHMQLNNTRNGESASSSFHPVPGVGRLEQTLALVREQQADFLTGI